MSQRCLCSHQSAPYKGMQEASTLSSDTLSAAARADVAAMEREAEALRLRVDAERRRGEELGRERDLLTKLRTQAEGASHRQACPHPPSTGHRPALACYRSLFYSHSGPVCNARLLSIPEQTRMSAVPVTQRISLLLTLL